MDCFSLFMDGINLLGQGVMHVLFVSRLTGKKSRPLYFAVYALLLTALQLVSVRLSLGGTLSVAMGVLELYILQTSYSFFAPVVSLAEVGRHSTLLLQQAMGLAALLCTLYAYRQLCQGFQARAELQSLTQAAQAQKVYIAEAQARYEQKAGGRYYLSVLLNISSLAS